MYTIDRVNDFVHLNWLDKRYASFEKMSFAIFPHAPSVRFAALVVECRKHNLNERHLFKIGIPFIQPIEVHFGSFKSCLRHSTTKAADPAVTHTWSMRKNCERHLFKTGIPFIQPIEVHKIIYPVYSVHVWK